MDLIRQMISQVKSPVNKFALNPGSIRSIDN